MKRMVIKEFVFLLILLLFLLPNVSSVEEGQCEIVTRAECDDIYEEGHIVMGLTGITNSHGQLPSETTYPYVLCCRVGTGKKTCDNFNEIIGLSAITNAHAENPALTNYDSPVCYEEIICRMESTETSCDSVLENGVLSLSAETNAHIGPYEGTGSYPNKICCTKLSMPFNPPCVVHSVKWETGNEIEGSYAVLGKKAPIIVTGEGNCDGRTVYVEVWKQGLLNADTKKTSLTLTFEGVIAKASWEILEADDIDVGDKYYLGTGLTIPLDSEILGGLADSVIQSADVEILSPNYCDNIASCWDYPDEASCNSRIDMDEQITDLCGTSPELNPSGMITGLECSKEASCNCLWWEEENVCSFNQEGTTSQGYCGDNFLSTPNENGFFEECDVDSGTSIFFSEFDNCAELSTTEITYQTKTPLVCRACTINILASGCDSTTDEICGDGVINQVTEVCDGDAFGGKSCVTQGGLSGLLKCSSSCQLDISECIFPTVTGGTGAKIKILTVEDDGEILTWEKTVSGTGYTIGDKVVAISETSKGSGGLFKVKAVIDGGITELEILDGGRGYIVNEFSNLEDQENMICGDGKVSRNAGNFDEQCDSNNMPGKSGTSVFDLSRDSCSEIGVGLTGTLVTCNSACTLVTNCEGTKMCGNGIIDQVFEECDTKDFQGLTCQYLSAITGTLTCDDQCKIVYGCKGVSAGTRLSYTYRTETIQDCEEGNGKKTIRLNKVASDGTIESSQENIYPCPSYVQLPFFDFVQMIVAMIIIAGIYVVVLFKKSKK